MTTKESKCHFCGNDAETDKGVIWVRYKVNGKWDNVIECYPCWLDKEHEKGLELFK